MSKAPKTPLYHHPYIDGISVSCCDVRIHRKSHSYSELATNRKKEHNQELDREGTRMPPRPIICIINEQGVQTDIPSEDIISYELWDISGSCIVSLADDKEFVQYLYSSIQMNFKSEL